MGNGAGEGSHVRKFGSLLAVLTACLGTVGVNAHHSFAVHFVGDEIVSVSGVVTEFRFRNPHGLLVFSVDDGSGEPQEWRAETNSPNVLRRRGWSADSIKAGDEVTVYGYPSRDGSNFMRIYRVVYPDGRELTGQRPMPSEASGDD
jgi:hypothetical protein